MYSSWIALSTGLITIQRISVRTHNRFIQLDSDLFEWKDSVIYLLNHWGQNDIIPSKRKS